ncbi:MAG: hypothetical protein NZ893_02960, partial [Candidatus Aenigmarchaeota archaeon]|nr:hypothetical protein [Candidatus Aenigmarchaeota archaeon]
MLSSISDFIWRKKYKTEQESSFEETAARVAKAIADNTTQEKKFFDIIASLKFLPGGRILAYAGRGNQKATLSNCYVMPDPEDSMDDIMKSLHQCALTMKAGGGIGLNFSKLRPVSAPDVRDTYLDCSSVTHCFQRTFFKVSANLQGFESFQQLFN